jgi:hypothetical protein
MYIERLPGLQARLHTYQEKTRNLELSWHPPVPVPTLVRSKRYDYYFSWGRFEIAEEANKKGTESTSIAVFSKNPMNKVDLRDPRAYMLVLSPFDVIEDLIIVFNTHIHEKDMGMVAQTIQVIKGVEPQLPSGQREAEKFNFLLNRELAILFSLAVREAHVRALINTEIELSYLENVTFGSFQN